MLTEKTACYPGRFLFQKGCRKLLKPVFLTDAFYRAYVNFPEIEQKETRPYICIQVIVDGVLWGIPLRSHIKHGYAIWTDKENGCGIDFTKAVVIENPEQYISPTRPYIRPEEFKVLKTIDSFRVSKKMKQYIKDYKKAKQNQSIPRNKLLVQFSTLQYFENYLDI